MTTSSNTKHILFVDDDPLARLMVETILLARLAGVRVTTAVHGAQALAVLAREPVDLLITDLSMPVMDGVELLLSVAHRRIQVPVLVVTANDSPAAETAALAGGAIEYFEKPIEEARFIRCVQDLLLAGGGRSQLEVVSLAGIVRLIGTDRRTCSLQVTTAMAQGVLIFTSGDLVDARQGELSGLPAALTILGWDEVTMNLDIKARARARTIHARVGDVLEQARRRRPPFVTAPPPRLAAPVSLASHTPPLTSPRQAPPVPAPPRITAPARAAAPRRPGGANAYTSRTGAASSTVMASLAPTTANRDAAATPAATEAPTPSEAAIAGAPPIPCEAPITAEPSPALAATITIEQSPALAATITAEPSPALAATITIEAAIVSEASPASDAPTVSEIREHSPAQLEREAPANSAPTVVAPTVVAAPVDYAESDTYFDLVDRARDLLRIAQFEAAERLLLRALEVQPGDRVAQQNLRVLARRRGVAPSDRSPSHPP